MTFGAIFSNLPEPCPLFLRNNNLFQRLHRLAWWSFRPWWKYFWFCTCPSSSKNEGRVRGAGTSDFPLGCGRVAFFEVSAPNLALGSCLSRSGIFQAWLPWLAGSVDWVSWSQRPLFWCWTKSVQMADFDSRTFLGSVNGLIGPFCHFW